MGVPKQMYTHMRIHILNYTAWLLQADGACRFAVDDKLKLYFTYKATCTDDKNVNLSYVAGSATVPNARPRDKRRRVIHIAKSLSNGCRRLPTVAEYAKLQPVKTADCTKPGQPFSVPESYCFVFPPLGGARALIALQAHAEGLHRPEGTR